MADKLELLIQRLTRADKLRGTDKRAADRIAERKRLGEYDPNSRMAQKARNDLIMAAIEMMESDGFAEGGDVKRPTPTYKSMDMGGDILDSYLAGLGNSKDTTIKGGGSKKKPKPIKKAKGGLVSPRKAQGMYRG